MSRALALRVTRLINAPRERIFVAWITPDDLLKWFGPEECQVLSAKVHPRAGGEYQFRLKTENYGEINLHGIFRELKRPEQTGLYLEHQRPSETGIRGVAGDGGIPRPKGRDGDPNHPRQLPNEEVKEDHDQGWNGCLDKLEKHLGVGSADAAGQPMPVGEFCWNELLTSDEAGAAQFYTRLFGWQTADFPGGEVKYTLFGRAVARKLAA